MINYMNCHYRPSKQSRPATDTYEQIIAIIIDDEESISKFSFSILYKPLFILE